MDKSLKEILKLKDKLKRLCEDEGYRKKVVSKTLKSKDFNFAKAKDYNKDYTQF
jgi:hypothetical protein